MFHRKVNQHQLGHGSLPNDEGNIESIPLRISDIHYHRLNSSSTTESRIKVNQECYCLGFLLALKRNDRRYSNSRRKSFKIFLISLSFYIVSQIFFHIVSNHAPSFSNRRAEKKRKNPHPPLVVFINENINVLPLNEIYIDTSKKTEKHDTYSFSLRHLSPIYWYKELKRKNEESIRETKNKMKRSRAAAHHHLPFEDETCKAMHKWQMDAYPTCNSIHEIDLTYLVHGTRQKNDEEMRYKNVDSFDDTVNIMLTARGGFRDVWRLRDSFGNDFVLKTLIPNESFSYRDYDRHRRDAIATSQLSSSIHIANIYAYCTNSGIYDFSEKGTLMDQIGNENQNKETDRIDIIARKKWTDEQILRYSWQVATAVADVHTFGSKNGSASISHTDISPSQFLWIDGMFKLNDFNRARFIRWDVADDKPCTFYIEKNPGKYRSPEEYAYKDLTEKIDVYSLGNILYIILTQTLPFENEEKSAAQHKVLMGEHPMIPEHILLKANSIEKSIIHAIEMCYQFDAQTRASAQDVARYLTERLKKLSIREYDS